MPAKCIVFSPLKLIIGIHNTLIMYYIYILFNTSSKCHELAN